MIWRELHHPIIQDGYLISPDGKIRNKLVDEDMSYTANYRSTNGYDFAIFNIKEEYQVNGNPLRLFPIDEIVAMVYIPVPDELKGKPLTIKHVNGDTRDISLINLLWVEDIEIWKDVTYPRVRPETYQVSNYGGLRNKKRKRIINGTLTPSGYIRCSLRMDDNTTRQLIQHRLVAWEFLHNDEKFDKFDVNHICGIKTNNFVKNLEIVDRLTNIHHAYMLKLNENKTCENANRSTITNATCEKICQKIVEYNGNIDDVVINLEDEGIHVSRNIIGLILYKISWTDISDKYFTKDQFRQRLFADEVDKICQSIIKYKGSKRLVSDVYNELIDTIPNVSKKSIRSIIDKEHWANISDKYFSKGDLRRQLNENEAIMIIKELAKYKGEKCIDKKVFNNLKDRIPKINIHTVKNIRHKVSFSKLSDKYF